MDTPNMINNGAQKSDATSIPHSQQDFQKVSYTPPDPVYARIMGLIEALSIKVQNLSSNQQCISQCTAQCNRKNC